MKVKLKKINSFLIIALSLFVFGFSKVSAKDGIIGAYPFDSDNQYDVKLGVYEKLASKYDWFACTHPYIQPMYCFGGIGKQEYFYTRYISMSNVYVYKFSYYSDITEDKEPTFYERYSFNESMTYFIYFKNFILPDFQDTYEFEISWCDKASTSYLCSIRDENNIVKFKAGDKLMADYNYFNNSVEYQVNYYFDNVLQEDLTYISSGNVGCTITIENKSNDVYLDKGDNTYNVVLKDKDNVFNIYYFSKTYGTNYQQINTDNNQLWFPFSYDSLKSLFPSIDFTLWTSYEQFSFTILFNILFILLLFVILYLCYRLFLAVKNWFL